MSRKVPFHQSEDGSEVWRLVVNDDGTYLVEHTGPAGIRTLSAGEFIARQRDDSDLLRLLRIAIAKTVQ